jgi:nicotinate-nucleotide adenylyltransferase
VRTGLLGGTFDPPHIAHFHAGECAMHQARLDRVLYVPAGDPWQKAGREISPGRHRLAMVEAAIAGVPGFEADGRELGRGGPSYTLDTLETFPEDEELFLILGADAAVGLPTWHRADDVLERVTVLVVPRPGTDSTRVLEVVPEAVFVDMAVLEVSGTEIRRMAGSDEPYRFLVPEGVFWYIEANGLYANRREGDMVAPSSETEERP